MKTPKEIYEAYKIMPNLQLHQLRVAAVGKSVCESFSESVHSQDILLACLFHDMGNILKFDLTYFPEALEPQGLEYWENVKKEFADTYGRNQHVASLAIGKEIGLSENVLHCIDAIAFSKVESLASSGTWEEKICEYVDLRVAPHGVDSLQARVEDGRKRYMGRPSNTGVTSSREEFDALLEAGHDIERQLFLHSSITPESITDVSVAPIVEKLWEYPIA